MQLKDQGKCNQDSLKKKIKCHGKGENLSQKTCERILGEANNLINQDTSPHNLQAEFK